MRPDALYLDDIVEAADAIARFLTGVDRAALLASDLHQSAVLQKLMVIGEAAARLSHEFRGLHSEVAWADIIGMRNAAAHAYFGVNWSIIWETAVADVPHLRGQVAAILEAEYPDSDAPTG